MTEPKPSTTRRNFLKDTGAIAGASAFAGLAAPLVHAAEDNTIQLALVGCGGRGTGAVGDALSVNDGPIKIVAMADAYEDRLNSSFDAFGKNFGDKVDIPADRKFVGFDAYRKAMDCLKAGDVVILATPPAFRWPMFRYAIDKGLNVFMEKPVTVDGPTSRRMFELGEESVRKNLKVGVGLMCRHCKARGELHDRIKNGEIGDLILMRAYRAAGPTASAFSPPKPKEVGELEYQIRRFHSFLWASGGAFSDFLIHNIDEVCWMKDAWPVEAKGFGGRNYRGNDIDQNFDSYTTEYTFPDGSKFLLEGRCMVGCHQEFASYAHGSKGSAVISASGHAPAKCKIYKGQNMSNAQGHRLAVPPARAEPVPARVGRPDPGDPRGQAVQRGQARGRGEPRDVDGPHGLPHRPGHHPRRHPQRQAGVRPRRRQADQRRPRAAAGQRRGQVPHPAARPGGRPRVLNRIGSTRPTNRSNRH